MLSGPEDITILPKPLKRSGIQDIYSRNMPSGGLMQLIAYGAQDIYMGSYYDPKKTASETINEFVYRQWKIVLAKRRLSRLKICREIEHLPGLGIKYFSSLQHFQQIRENIENT